jgi:protein-S-isoprenylcysteine O-methyltransferase Ste14
MSGVSLALRNIAFTVVVPGSAGVYVPWVILRQHGAWPAPAAWYGTVVIAAGALLYLACVWVFATTGRGTPGPWDAPKRVVAVGPYRWVRNPIYLAALLIVTGQAWLFWSAALLLYAVALAAAFHLAVTCYEEPHLRRRFGPEYLAYWGSAGRWIPRRPDPAPRAGGRGARSG